MGGRVVLTGRNKSALEKLEAELKTDSLVVVGDVTSEKDVENVVEQAVQKFEQIDVLVNGMYVPLRHRHSGTLLYRCIDTTIH